jgi:toxin ParE1/3/4
MAQVRWTSQAARDLETITEFIARDSSHYARLFAIDVIQAVERVSLFPASGRVVPELDDQMIREVLLGDYRIVYRMGEDYVELLTIYHGARLLNPGRSR